MSNILRTIVEFVIALIRLFVLLTGGLIAVLLYLRRWINSLLQSENLFEEEVEDSCGELPEAIVRRPDPCLYSQELLMSQGLPVTWNNPDIWIAPADDPTNVSPDSYHLEEDTDYIVFVRISNASATDPAIGARVRLHYRPWSFSSPDQIPVETDTDGDEVVKFVNVSPASSDVVEFDWHTPELTAGESHKHFCLQAMVDHPMDTNVSNNMGQENTNVYQRENPGPPRPGDKVALTVPLVNPADIGRRVTFETNTFALDETDEPYELRLQTTRAYAYNRESLGDRLGNIRPIFRSSAAQHTSEPLVHQRSHSKTLGSVNRISLQPRSPVVAEKHRYVGYENVREDILGEDHALPDGMRITIDDGDPEKGVSVDAGEERDIQIGITIPEEITPGTTVPVNITARDQDKLPLGGVTVVFAIEEE